MCFGTFKVLIFWGLLKQDGRDQIEERLSYTASYILLSGHNHILYVVPSHPSQVSSGAHRRRQRKAEKELRPSSRQVMADRRRSISGGEHDSFSEPDFVQAGRRSLPLNLMNGVMIYEGDVDTGEDETGVFTGKHWRTISHKENKPRGISPDHAGGRFWWSVHRNRTGTKQLSFSI